MKIAFGIMSAVHSAATVQQLVDALQPYPVLIHHDFSQQPDFVIEARNARFVDNACRTGWDDWGFSKGIFRLLDEAMADSEVDYFQLLSPTCLPIRPLDEFAAMLARDEYDAHNEFFDLQVNDAARINFAYRAYAHAGSLRCRILWRCFNIWAGRQWHTEDGCNLQLRIPDDDRPGLDARFAEWVSRLARDGWLSRHPFNDTFRVMAGGTWFGVNRVAAKRMLALYADPRVQDWFPHVHLADEMLISTLIGNSSLRVGPSNHYVNVFDEARPREFKHGEIDQVMASGRFFGRKFPDDPTDPGRLSVIRRIAPVELTDTSNIYEWKRSASREAPAFQS